MSYSTTRCMSKSKPNLPKCEKICVHMDNPPGIVPIPFKLDFDDKPCINAAGDPKPPRNGTKLDLPHVHFSSRALNFSIHRKPDYSLKKFKEFKKASKIAADSSPVHAYEIVKLHMGRLDTLDNMQRNMKKKLGVLMSNNTVTVTVKGQKISVSGPVAVQKPKGRMKTDKKLDEAQPVTAWQQFVKPYNWIGSTDLFQEPVLGTLRKAWNRSNKPFIPAEVSKTAKQIGISSKLFKSLSLITTEMLESVLECSCRAIVPDLLKMLALTAWQCGDSSKTFFHLSEAQNFFIRREVLEKHYSYFTKKSHDKCRENCNETQTTDLDLKREELYRIQSNHLQTFGDTPKIFENNLAKFNPEWNVIQLTKLFHHKNRFGATQNGVSPAFAIFISALVSIEGKRCPFTVYQPPPVTEVGLSKKDVIQGFRVLMVKNRKLNEQYRGTRQKYWKLRSEHNVELKTLLDCVEENWLFPWDFLLPGNVMDKSIISYIRNCLTQIERTLKTPLTTGGKGVLYKLVENYNILKPRLLPNLSQLIGWVIDVSDEIAEEISTLVIQYGSGLNLQSYSRSPTILVLDQELDLIPWESMECLKSTPVTRVPSIATLSSLSLLRELKKEKYLEPIDPNNCGFVLNPDGTLKGVEQRLSAYFNGVTSWTGITGRKPTQNELESYFQTKDLYLYCGHGSGTAYFSEHRIQRVACRAVPLLMGCGSVRYKHHGPRSMSTSIVSSLFSATSVCSVGFLYEVTDLECDRVTLELLERWAPGATTELPEILSFDSNARRHRERCLAAAVRLARGGATQFFTSAGLVCYGIPVLTNDV